MATKLNIAHYSINEYFVEKESEVILTTINQFVNDNQIEQAQWINDYFDLIDGKIMAKIVIDADAMFTGSQKDFELEAMMKMLDNINNLHDNLNYCAPLPITLNEIFPNPIGDDNKIMPNGEWIELYNFGNSDIDVSDWYLYNSLDNQPIMISGLNADNNNDTADFGETIVPANGWLVVYINGMHALEWISDDGDEIRLYDGILNSAELVSYYSFNNSVPENKSIARIPDGIGQWYDSIPTPGLPNIPDKISQPNLDNSENFTSEEITDVSIVEPLLSEDIFDIITSEIPEETVVDDNLLDFKNEGIFVDFTIAPADISEADVRWC